MSNSQGEPFKLAHPWNLSPREARQVQLDLREQVRIDPLPLSVVERVAGLDASFYREKIYAAVVLLNIPNLDLIEQASIAMPVSFPYIPGLLSFREAPGMLAAIRQLNQPPDVCIVDGHGLAHPRSFGIACHLGLLLDVPTIGCAKSLLVGEALAPANTAGSYSEITRNESVIGAALRTRQDVKPLYVSVGHRVDLESAIQVVMACLSGYRLPEPIRKAHSLANENRKSI